MRWKSLWVHYIVALCGGFILAFSTSKLYPFLALDTGWYDVGYLDTYPPFWVNEIVKLAPEAEQTALRELLDELSKKENAELNQLKAYGNLCALGVLNCRGLSNPKVTQALESVLADRQMALSVGATQAALSSAKSADRANHISALSLVIAFMALIFGVLSYFGRKRGAH